MAKQGEAVHCQRGHELTISQLPTDMRWHVLERKWCGDEEINLSPDSCPVCQSVVLPEPEQELALVAAD